MNTRNHFIMDEEQELYEAHRRIMKLARIVIDEEVPRGAGSLVLQFELEEGVTIEELAEDD